MGRFNRIAATAVIGAWLAGCSGSGATHAQRDTAPGRDLRLPEAPSGVAVVASDLEVGRPLTSKAASMPHGAHPSLGAKAVAEAPMEAASVLPGPSVEAERLLEPVPMPESHTIYLAPTGDMEVASPVNVSAATSLGGAPHIGQEYGGSRGPAIIIRGGMGGIDDKCDLRPRGFGGTAINRLAPPIGGRSGRGGIR